MGVSFGKGCGNKDYPGVYAKVSAAKKWIDENIIAWDCTPSSGRRRRKLKATKPPIPKKPKAEPGCEWKLEWTKTCKAAPTPSPTMEGKFCEFVLSDANMKDAVQMYKEDAAKAIAVYGDPKYWSTKDVTDFSYLFKSNTNFNADISGWDTSKVTNMDRMFNQASNFNIDIGGWNTAKVTNVDAMFAEADNFNQDVSMWDLSKVEVYGTMFMGASKFNQDLCPWNNYDNLMASSVELQSFLKETSCNKKATPQKLKF